MNVSICVPVFKEENSNVAKMLANLRTQIPAEIVIAEYDPDNTSRLAKNYPNVKYVPVERPGIAYARHTAIMAASGSIICNFDADCYWPNAFCLKTMVHYIIKREAVMTCCDNAFDYAQVPPARLYDMEVPQTALNALNSFQKTGWAVLEPGSCFSKAVYIEVGGFDDVNRWELAAMTPRIFYKYPSMLRHIPSVTVMTSPRRALKLGQLGLQTLDYNMAIRKNRVLGVN